MPPRKLSLWYVSWCDYSPSFLDFFLLILVSFKGSSIMFLDVFMILVSCKGFCKILSTTYFLILVSCKGFYRILSRHTTWFLLLVKVCRDVAFSCQGLLRCYVYPLFLAYFFVEDFFIYGFSYLFLILIHSFIIGILEVEKTVNPSQIIRLC